MGAPSVPPVIPIPWATNNPSLRTDIPDTTTDPGQASWDQGFPSDTMQPVVAGGVPPFGQNFNGVEFTLSSHDYYVQAGQTFPFQAAVATAIGGYGVGAILGSATDANTVWFNTAANNSTDPDATDGSAVGWVSLFAYGFATFAPQTGASPLTLNNVQASRKFIVLTGALTNPLTVFIPANLLQQWLVINNTTGAFSTTIKTTASSSAGVNVPQGGFSNPLGVYSDGTNVYPTVAPLGVPISQGPDPSTLVERDNLANITGNQFIGVSAFETPGVTGLPVLGADTSTFRKVTLAYFESIMNLAAMGGQVSAGQVPLAAVLQYITTILNNAALTGVPTAPTAASGTSNTEVATTAFANPSATLALPGQFRLPGGHVVQYGLCNPNGGTVTVTLPVGYSSAATYIPLVTGLSHPTTNNATIVDGQHINVTNSGGQAFWATIGF